MREVIAGRRRAIALAAAGSLVLVAGLWALTYTSLFAARELRVHGNSVLRARDVRAIAGISAATNVVHLDRAAITDRLEAQPWIADATVQTDLPNTVVLTIHERQPVGVIEALGRRSILSSDGSALPMPDTPVAQLPIVRAALGEPTGTQRDAAALVLDALDPVVLARVDGVLVGQDGDIRLRLVSGVAVDIGERGQEEEKATALRAILRWAAQEHVHPTSIDVSSPAAPSVELPNGSTVLP
jgi:cell division protein FtsQ